MKVVLCATSDTISYLWKSNLEETEYEKEVVKSQDSLMQYLTKHQNDRCIVCLEDLWVGGKFENLEELIINITQCFAKADIMIFSQYPSFSLGKTLLCLGIKGYGNARMQSVYLKDAFSCIKEGNVWVYPEFVQNMIHDINKSSTNIVTQKNALEDLTLREKEIAWLIYEGKTNKEISQATNIALRTVKSHTTSIYKKLDVKDRIALVLLLKAVK